MEVKKMVEEKENKDIIKDAKNYEKNIKEPEQPEMLQLDLLFKATQINTTLIWLAATMSTIAAINSLTGETVLLKGVIFMLVGLASLIIYKRRLKE